MSLWFSIGVGVIVAVSTAAAHADAAADLERGGELYYAGRYEEALSLLEALGSNEQVDQATRSEALKLQAFTLYLMERTQEAGEVWRRLLRFEPERKLDPVEVSPDLVSFFGAILPESNSNQARPGAGPRRQEHAVALEKGTISSPAKHVVAAPEERSCSMALCFVPFGVGQFVNGDTGKGLIFAGSELAFLAANMTFYWTRVREIDRLGKPRDPDAADRSFLLQHVFLGLFVATAIGGVVEAVLAS